METRTLMSFNDAFTASLVKGRLESAGIQCWLRSENFMSLMPQYSYMQNGGIDLMVNNCDYERAQAVLGEQTGDDGGESASCPFCHSDNIEKRYGSRLFSYLLLFLMLMIRWVPGANSLKTSYLCRDCGRNFK